MGHEAEAAPVLGHGEVVEHQLERDAGAGPLGELGVDDQLELVTAADPDGCDLEAGDRDDAVGDQLQVLQQVVGHEPATCHLGRRLSTLLELGHSVLPVGTKLRAENDECRKMQ